MGNHLPLTKDEKRRAELADFLHTRRARLSPSDVGLPQRTRRRVAGLRREEVAELADISVTWYTWLEQARPRNVSALTLERIAQALQLDSQEREHLFLLAGHPTPLPLADTEAQIMGSVNQLLASMEPNPAYVLNSRWDLTAWNRATVNVFGDFGRLPQPERNLVWMTFMDPAWRHLFVEWESFARCVLAHFRSDSASHVGDPRWAELTGALTTRSKEFRAWWPCHEVTWRLEGCKELLHPAVGKLCLHSLNLELHHPARLRVVTYTPTLDSDTAQRLTALARATDIGRERSRPDQKLQRFSIG